MENIITISCHDIKLSLEENGIIIAKFICHDQNDKPMKTISASIHKQVKEIYRNKINADFVRRLEYKIKFTMKLIPAILTFEKKNEEWILKTPLCEIYSPVSLTTGCLKVGDNPLTVNAEIVKLLVDKGKVFLQCLATVISAESNEFEQSVITVRINAEVNNLYSEKVSREKIRELLNIKEKNKPAFLEAFGKYLEGKIVKLEYDEHFEYSLWTFLYDFFVFDYGNK